MVDRTNPVWEIKLENHKTAWRGKSRTIYVGPLAQAVLLPYLNRREDAYCFNPKEAVRQKLKAREESRVTPKSYGNSPGTNRVSKPSRKPGNCYSTASYGRSIKYGCRLAFPAPEGLKGEALRIWKREHQFAPNQLRHALATAVRRTDGLEAASVILGHSSLAITQTYAEQDRSNAIAVVGRVG
jgi:integrase